MQTINTESKFTAKPQAQKRLTMAQQIALAVGTLVQEVEVLSHHQRGIEPNEPDDVTLAAWTKAMSHKVTRGERIRLGQLSASFSALAGRPKKEHYGPMGPVRLHAVSSLNRAMEVMGISA